MEPLDGLQHQVMYFCRAKIADTAFMGVMDMMVGMECACLNLHSHLLVSITERCAAGSQTVNFLHGEHRVVHRIVQNMFVHLYFVDDIGSHLQTVLEFIECRKKYLLDYLKVTEVSYRQIVHDEHHLLGE